MDTFELNWYVLHTKSRAEKVVNSVLLKKQMTVFLPEITVRSKRKDRKKMLDVPLFPGYLFIQTDLKPDEHLNILKTPGVVRLIGNTNGPVPVPETAVGSLRIMIHSGESIVTGPSYSIGEVVRVKSGAFEGVTGIFQTYKGEDRVIVNIDILGQSASVNVSVEDIEKIT